MDAPKKLSFLSLSFGCDPEFFFRDANGVVGAENILPASGLEYNPGSLGKTDGANTVKGQMLNSKIIIDGVQAELNPRPNTCRANLGNEISCCFQKLVEHMKDKKQVSVDFSQTVSLTEEDFDKLSDNSKKLGCMPSKNAHNNGRVGKITVNPDVYRTRSAGGHIHCGNAYEKSSYAKEDYEKSNDVLQNPVRFVEMLDILVGNTCVLLDRDPGNIERRKVYGKAGEFRTPPHGVEYRTLSNFWLKSYQLMSLVMGLTRHAFIIVANDRDGEFKSLVNMRDIAEAINKNDFDLALSNFNKIKQLLLDVTLDQNTEHYCIRSGNILLFEHFVKKGIDYWFKQDPVTHWCEMPEGHNTGFGTFLATTVKQDLENTTHYA